MSCEVVDSRLPEASKVMHNYVRRLGDKAWDGVLICDGLCAGAVTNGNVCFGGMGSKRDRFSFNEDL